MFQPRQLPGPNVDSWDWQMQGACRGVDSSMFFPPDGERGQARAQREMRAKEMCRSCPVIAQCRSHALVVGEHYGVWGGLSESEREGVRAAATSPTHQGLSTTMHRRKQDESRDHPFSQTAHRPRNLDTHASTA